MSFSSIPVTSAVSALSCPITTFRGPRVGTPRENSEENEEESPQPCISAPVSVLYYRSTAVIEDGGVLPKCINGKYYKDYDINYVHNIIQEKLRRKSSPARLAKLTERLRCYEEQQGRVQTISSHKITMEEMTKLRDKIDELRKGTKMNEYMEKTKPLIQSYRELGAVISTVIFSSQKDTNQYIPLTDTDYIRIDIIRKYLNIAKEYIVVEVQQEIDNTNKCEGCLLNLEEVSIDDNGLQICPGCGSEQYYIVSSTCRYGKNLTMCVLHSRNEYMDHNNFIKAFYRYQGLQNNKLPSDYIARLDGYFINIGRPKGEEIKHMPITYRRYRGDTNHAMLYDALQATGLSDYYEDANLIGSLYWGWILPDMKQHEATILEHYKKTQAVYLNLHRTRSSSLGTQYRLFKHLQLVGADVIKEEFKIAGIVGSSIDSIEDHESMWEQMCIGANDPNIYYIPTL